MLEKRFGKHAINQALEETYSAEWLEKYAKACPYCGTQIQVGREQLALKHFVSQLVVGEIHQGLPLLWDTDSGRSKMMLEFKILFVSYWM